MENQISWSLRGATVITADDAQLLMPHGNHQLLIGRALEALSDDKDFEGIGKATVDNLPWSIKAIVESNNGRTPVWATHLKCQLGTGYVSQNCYPFVYADRDLRPPTTKSLTLEITGTASNPFLASVYPGRVLPPLPWELYGSANLADYEMSAAFWRTHSFLFDGAIARHKQDTSPNWFIDAPSPLALLLR